MSVTNGDQEKSANQFPKCEKYVGFLKLSITFDYGQIKILWADLDLQSSLFVYYSPMPDTKI